MTGRHFRTFRVKGHTYSTWSLDLYRLRRFSLFQPIREGKKIGSSPPTNRLFCYRSSLPGTRVGVSPRDTLENPKEEQKHSWTLHNKQKNKRKINFLFVCTPRLRTLKEYSKRQRADGPHKLSPRLTTDLDFRKPCPPSLSYV